MNHCVLGDDAELRRIRLDNLELHRAHTSSNKESIALANGAVGLQEVGLEVNVEQVAGKALDGIVEWQNVYALAVFNVVAWMYGAQVTKLDAKVVTSHCTRELTNGVRQRPSEQPLTLVHLNLALRHVIASQAN